MYDTHILTEHDCRSLWEHGLKVGYCVNLTINYYRGLPISCIDQISLVVDGEKVDPASMFVQHHGREYPYLFILSDECPTDFYWTFGDYLRVVIKEAGWHRPGCPSRQAHPRHPPLLHTHYGLGL